MKRFWDDVSVIAEAEGHGIALDGRPLRTPGRAPCTVPSRALADAVADEWRAVYETVDPRAMPLTRSANTAIDRVLPEHAAVAEIVSAYGQTDLLCYRAPHPEALAAREAAAWDPLLDWSGEVLSAPLVATEGVIHVPQAAGSLAALAGRVSALDGWRLTALHDLVTLTGSLVLGLAVVEGRLAPEEAWTLSRIDEDWNIEEWGEDAEAAVRTALRRDDFLLAARLLELLDKG